MSARRGRRSGSRGSQPSLASARNVESWPDGDWVVSHIRGSSSTKDYRCPGCSQLIRPATPHVVAWPNDSDPLTAASPLDERRHWHTACWAARDRRRAL